MVEKKKDLEKKEPTLPTRVSGKDGTALGFENMDMETDIQMPRVAILQGLSEMVQEKKAESGKIVNAITKEIYGDELIFIPLFLFKSRCKFELGTGLVCSSRDALTCSFNSDGEHEIGDDCLSCEDAKWPERGKMEDTELGGPACSMVYNYPVLNCTNIHQFPVSISLMRTATKGARKLNSLLRYTGEDFFSTKVKMTTQMQKGSKGIYYVPVFEIAGRASDEEYTIAKSAFKLLRGKVIEVKMEEEAPNFSE